MRGPILFLPYIQAPSAPDHVILPISLAISSKSNSRSARTRFLIATNFLENPVSCVAGASISQAYPGNTSPYYHGAFQGGRPNAPIKLWPDLLRICRQSFPDITSGGRAPAPVAKWYFSMEIPLHAHHNLQAVCTLIQYVMFGLRRTFFLPPSSMGTQGSFVRRRLYCSFPRPCRRPLHLFRVNRLCLSLLFSSK